MPCAISEYEVRGRWSELVPTAGTSTARRKTISGPLRDRYQNSGLAPRSSRGELAAKILAAIVGMTAGSLWAWCLLLVANSRFSTDPAADPHGYSLFFGILVAVPCAAVTTLTLPWAFGRKHRVLAAMCLTAVSLISSVLLLVALFTS